MWKLTLPDKVCVACSANLTLPRALRILNGSLPPEYAYIGADGRLIPHGDSAVEAGAPPGIESSEVQCSACNTVISEHLDFEYIDTRDLLRHARDRLRHALEVDCECDNTHQVNGTKCVLCELADAIPKDPVAEEAELLASLPNNMQTPKSDDDDPCGGLGWLFSDDGEHFTIVRCDTCKKYESDVDALASLVKMSQQK